MATEREKSWRNLIEFILNNLVHIEKTVFFEDEKREYYTNRLNELERRLFCFLKKVPIGNKLIRQTTQDATNLIREIEQKKIKDNPSYKIGYVNEYQKMEDYLRNIIKTRRVKNIKYENGTKKYIQEYNADKKQEQDDYYYFSDEEIKKIRRNFGFIKEKSIDLRADMRSIFSEYYKMKVYRTRREVKDETHHSLRFGIIKLESVDHVRELLEYYEDVDLTTDIGLIIHEINKLIEKTKLTENEKAILQLFRNEQLDITSISETMDVSYQYVSDALKNIAKKISTIYRLDKIEWNDKKEGKATYKTCSKCKESKIASNRYFGYDKRNKDDLKSICKECDSKSKTK
jgi:hypothetical protein